MKLPISLVLLIFVNVLLIPALCISFDINNAKYKRGTDFWTVDIPLKDHSSSYLLAFESLPAGWKMSGNSLLIPSAVTKFDGNYPLKISVQGAAGIILRRTMLFKISGSGLYLGDYPYQYTFQTTSSTQQSASSSSGNISGAYIQNGEGSVSIVTNNSLSGSLRTQYSNLPSDSDLDRIIDSADVVLITKTIQAVISSNLNCLARMGYLSDFLGKIESYITIKGFRASDLLDIIRTANQTIISLNGKVNEYLGQIDGLKLTALKLQLNQALASLDAAYNLQNAANIDITPINIKINASQAELTNITGQITKANAQLTIDQKQVSLLDASILQLQAKLIAAQTDRSNYQARVVQSQQFLNTSMARVQQLQKNIAEFNLQIQQIQTNFNKLRQGSKNVQSQVDSIKNQIKIAEQRQGDLLNKITNLKIQIANQSLLLDDSQLNKIRQMINLLNDQTPTIRQKIDQLDLSCNGVVNISVQNLGQGLISYVFNPTQFQTYFTGYYGSTAYQQYLSSQSSATSGRFVFYPYDIFSNQWVQTYGASFSNDVSSAYNGGIITDYSFLSDFKCSQYDSLISLGAKITKIDNNIIYATGPNGTNYQLQLGACSRLNGVSQYYPRVGSNINFNGVQSFGNRYLVHTGTVY